MECLSSPSHCIEGEGNLRLKRWDGTEADGGLTLKPRGLGLDLDL